MLTEDPVTTEHECPSEIRDALCLLALLSGGANVVMQLSRLPVGHGVASSTVDSGRIDKHPLKRTRTTCAFLVIAMFGSEKERLVMRREIAKAHQHVHSQPADEVRYDAFDSQLQLWVAACLYKGVEDVTPGSTGRWATIAWNFSTSTAGVSARHCRSPTKCGPARAVLSRSTGSRGSRRPAWTI